jgi:sialic acid synthase SpsE
VGYSDHTIGNDAAIIAVALGARIIEKHFTLDHNYSSFRDHQISADAREMADLVARIKDVSMMLGSEAKTIQACEQSVVSLIRRSIVAGADLPIGHRIQFSDLTWIRPAGDLAPGQEDVVVGKQLQRSVKYGEQLNASDVK